MSDTNGIDTLFPGATGPGTTGMDANRADPQRPRIRVGALLWGLVLTAVSGYMLWIAVDPGRRADALRSVLDLSPLGWAVVVLVAVGGTITLLALAAVIRRAQRPRG